MGDERPIIKTTKIQLNTTREPTLQTAGSIFYPLINEKNSHQISKRREFPQNFTDFKSTLKSHPQKSSHLYDLTTYQKMYDRRTKPTAEADFERRNMRRDVSAGMLTDSRSIEGLKKSSILTAEQYRDYQDPQFNTHVQRSWVYGKENSLGIADGKLEKTVEEMK